VTDDDFMKVERSLDHMQRVLAQVVVSILAEVRRLRDRRDRAVTKAVIQKWEKSLDRSEGLHAAYGVFVEGEDIDRLVAMLHDAT